MLGLGILIIIAVIITIILCIVVYEIKGTAKAIVYSISVVFLVVGVVLTAIGTSSESFKRWQKNITSNYSGGLNRTITILDMNQEIVKKYQGKIDIEENNGEKLTFVLEGKKIIIYNSVHNTILVEEE